jgi:hypothetical protein
MIGFYGDERSAAMRARPLFAIVSLIFLGVVALLTGCGSSTATSATQNSSDNSTAQGKLDACVLITKADVAAIMGQSFKDGEHGLENDGGGGAAAFSECRFALTTDAFNKVSVFVRRSPVDDNSTAAIEQVRQTMREDFNATLHDVSGVGDVAFWAVFASGRQLHVFKDGNLYLFVSMSSKYPDDAMTLDKAKALAQKTLERLAG